MAKIKAGFESLVLAFLAFLVIVGLAVVTPLLYAAGGYFTGWILIHVFPFAGAWVSGGAQAFGISIDLRALPVVGAFLGFAWSFFKAPQSDTNKK